MINESSLRSLKPRTKVLNELSAGLKSCIDGERKEFEIQALSYEQISRMTDEMKRVKRLLSEDLDKLSNEDPIVMLFIGVAKMLKGQYTDVSMDTLQRISALKYGAVYPAIDHSMAVLIAEKCGIDFKQITDEIFILSQMGAIPMGEL